MMHTQSAALRYAELGLSPIPVFSAKHTDEAKRKRPTVQWKPYQDRIATKQELMCGAASRNLEILDFDEPALLQPFLEELRGHDAPLADKLVKQSTPSGGYHFLYRFDASSIGDVTLILEKVL